MALIAAVAAFGCGEESGPDAEALLAEPMTCGALEHQVCDVFDGACQEQLAAIAACQWGGQATAPILPEVVVLTQADLRQDIQAQSGAAIMDDGVNDVVSVVFELLRVSSVGDLGAMAVAETQSQSLGALYDPPTKVITMIDREVALDEATENGVLLHELVHAQQDAAHDLAALVAAVRTTDENVAARSLWEGEARFHEDLFLFGLGGLSPTEQVLTDAYAGFREAVEADIFASPSPFVSSLIATPYIYGPSFVQNLWVEGGADAVQARYAAVPTDSLEILRAAWGVEPLPYDATDFPLGNIFARPGEAFPAEGTEAYPLAIDRLGAWFVHMVGRVHADDVEARELALGWRGDQLDVFALDDGRAAGRWRVVFESPELATRFTQLFADNPNVQPRQDGVGTYLVVIEGDAPEWLFGPLAR